MRKYGIYTGSISSSNDFLIRIIRLVCAYDFTVPIFQKLHNLPDTNYLTLCNPKAKLYISAFVTKIKADKFCFEQKNELKRMYNSMTSVVSISVIQN